MQVTCFGINWNEVMKRDTPQRVAEEMLLTDDVDMYSKELPEGLWRSDSANQHFATAEAIEKLLQTATGRQREALVAVSRLISTGDPIDELGISPLTDGCYFISLSPNKVRALLCDFEALDIGHLPRLTRDAVEWLLQWQGALKFAETNRLGLIGHCG